MASHFSYDEAVVRRFLWAAYGWGLVALGVSLLVALQLGLGWNISWGGSGSALLRPLAAHVAVFGFVANAVFGGVYYSTPRLCKTPIWSRGLSHLHFWGWQAMLLAGAGTLLFGFRQGRPLAEFEWPIDLALAALWLVFALNFFGTLLRRRQRHMYISLWFYSAAIVAFAIYHVVGNLALPVALLESYPLFGGVRDVALQRWHASGALTFLATVPLMGLMYYVLPKASGRPVFSYRLSVVHLWSLVLFASLAGSHPSHYVPLPEWASTMGLVFSVLLLVPSGAGVWNGWLTVRGAPAREASDPALRFFLAGLLLYGLNALGRAVFALRSSDAALGFTDWGADAALGGALGWGSLMVFGTLYWLAPRVFQAPLPSAELCARHLWLTTAGVLLTTFASFAAGLAQGEMLRATSPEGQLLYPEFIDAFARARPFYWLGAVGACLSFAGALTGAGNILRTWNARPSTYAAELHHAMPLSRTYPAEVKPQPTLAAVLETAKKWEVFSTLWWHRRGERQPLRLGAWAGSLVLGASMLQLAPGFLASSTAQVPGSAAAESMTGGAIAPYTPLELLGREVYVSSGCVQCHSGVVRRLWSEAKRDGEVSEAREFAYDYPAQWGTRRTGPDLARQGGRRSTRELVQLLKDPAAAAHGSPMPAYGHLFEAPLRLDSLEARMAALRSLGVPYTEADIASAIDQATEQATDLGDVFVAQNGGQPYLDAGGRVLELGDSQGIALVAYLERLGTDRFKSPAEPELVQGGSR